MAPSKYQILLLVCALCNSCWSCTTVGNETCREKCDYTDWAFDANCHRQSLKAVPRECCMSHTVDLRNNQITVLNNGDFAEFSEITRLDIENNSMTDINPFAFQDSPKLDILHAQFNLLTIIHKNNFAGAPNLRQLFINNNNIFEVESGAFDANPNLQILYLSSNYMTVIQNDTFKGLTKLKHLSLGKNKIININSQMFEDLSSLQTLELFGNQIVSISIPELPNLKYLDLFDNDMKQVDDLNYYFDEETNTTKHNLEVLYLANNPLICSCSLKPLQKWLIDHKVSLGNDPRANATCFDLTKKVTVWLQNKNSSQICQIKTTTPPTQTTPTQTTPTLPSEHDYTIVVLIVSIIVICIVFGLGVYCVFCIKKKFRRSPECTRTPTDYMLHESML